MVNNINDEDFAEILEKKAKNGDAEFQHQVGECYYYGRSINQNYKEAVKWYTLAAKQGHPVAQSDLGHMYDFGYGVEANFHEAAKWYNRSAEQGWAKAQNKLAVCYVYGIGVEQNFIEAERLYLLASEQGYWLASSNLAMLYSDVKHDLVKAKEYFEKALKDIAFLPAPASEADIKDIEDNLNKVNNQLAEREAKVAAAREAQRTEVFVSYAHADNKEYGYKDELQQHLKMLENICKINYWDDTKITFGENWRDEIKKSLSATKVAILMTSANFFASDFIPTEEFDVILEARAKGAATILWVAVSTYDYKMTKLEPIQAVADPNKPLNMLTHADRDVIYTKIVQEIKELFKTL
jgi:hypothetical protein